MEQDFRRNKEFDIKSKGFEYELLIPPNQNIRVSLLESDGVGAWV